MRGRSYTKEEVLNKLNVVVIDRQLADLNQVVPSVM